MTNPDTRTVTAAIAALIILQLIMLGALYTQTAPHPPNAVPPFGIAPFLGASLAIAVAALIIGPLTSRTGGILTCLAGLCALVSYGPQKYLDAQFALIWPSVIIGQIASLTVFVLVLRPALSRNQASVTG